MKFEVECTLLKLSVRSTINRRYTGRSQTLSLILACTLYRLVAGAKFEADMHDLWFLDVEFKVDMCITGRTLSFRFEVTFKLGSRR